MKIGKKEISKAFKNIKNKITKETITFQEVDFMLFDELNIKYYDETKGSGDFADVGEVFEYVANIMRCHGYKSDWNEMVYIKNIKKNNEPIEGQIKLF